MNKNGFTLIELLIVIVVLGILGAMLVPAINTSIRINKEKLAKQTEQVSVVYENPEPTEPPIKEIEEDLEHLEPGQYLYYVSYFMNGSNPGACTVVMNNVVTNFSSVYGETNSLTSYIKMRASKNNLRVNSLIVNSFQVINHKE